MSASRRGRRPDPSVDAAIRAAVLDLAYERGLDMTFDEVAARAGVGRASVFRRFPTKRDMILDAVTQLTVARIRPPDTGSLRDDLVGAVREIMRTFGEPRLRGLARRFLGEACRDPVFTDVFRTNLDRRLEMLGVVLDRAVERGELPSTVDRAVLADLLSGLLAIRLVTGTPLPDPAEPASPGDLDEVAALVDGLLYGFARPGSAT